MESIQNSVKSWTWSDIGHTGLDVAGLVPGFGEAADVANAAWYVAEAKYLDAGLSLVSVIPVAKLGPYVAQIQEAVGKSVDDLRR